VSKLFVSDLDGTLLQPDERLSDFARGELIRLLGEGLPFTVASARSWASMRPIFDGVPLSLPVLEFNGTMATDLETGEGRFCHVIDAEIARAAAAAGVAAGITPFVSTAGDSAPGDALFPPDPVNDGMRYYRDNRRAARDYRLRPDGRLDEGLSRRVICLTFVDTQARLLELRVTLEKTFAGAVTNSFYENPYSTGWWWLTLQPALGTKAHAVAELAESLGLPIEDVTVFGDYPNDIPMFEAAGRAVAVENAAPELKRHADEIIGPHTDDSVVKYLAAHWDGRPPE
jgi:hydroxymethylpyrimidine pyrophosphatase-like HAD family hydrolase